MIANRIALVFRKLIISLRDVTIGPNRVRPPTGVLFAAVIWLDGG